ncbi:DUF6285 domain-containing protein [Hyphomonas jannaschiana]|uniref:DUF6285 domain-containing protein n=1 Tax=Hyphomonas jannaschiana VP2 TaxID=1280952 RepID=A0A059FBB1_9PROT|nr:DUF6285 domain-containing protein [Hyphomonas jannaschiana]KCZ87823.1 hypothetical protein HJA_12504 [Hyphomonas jannaschiana VP2]
MHDAPSTKELVEAVKRFIDDTASPQLTGHAAFHARVASNVLSTLIRELEQRPEAESAERARLVALLGAAPDTSLEDLNRDLCKRIQSGEMDLSSDGLLDHLKTTTIAQLSIDQPRYSGLALALQARG